MPTYSIKTELHGPLFDGRAIADARRTIGDIVKELGDIEVGLLRKFPMNKTGRARGGFQANLHAVQKNRTTVIIDGPQIKGVAWAPWLEGVSSRNASTRFKGYHLFRLTMAELRDRWAPEVTQKHVAELMRRIGGE